MRRTARVDYKHGHHVCTLFNSREEQIGAAVEFIQAGLAGGAFDAARTIERIEAAVVQ